MPPSAPRLPWAAMLALLWLGLLLGVSFLATPVKFLAPSLSLSVALDVGRQTFAALNAVELVLGLLLTALCAPGWRRGERLPALLALSLLGLVLVQRAWLLPLLDARVELILRGGEPPASLLHRVYIGLDLLKLGLLGTVAWRGLR